MVLESEYDSLAMTVTIMILMAMTDDEGREDDGVMVTTAVLMLTMLKMMTMTVMMK